MLKWFGTPGTEAVRQAMRNGEFGVIVTPAQGLYDGLEGVEMIVDNGSFGEGYPGDVEYLGFLAAIADKDSVRFAVAPDVVGDAEATLKRSRPFLKVIRALGFQVAFAAQNGLTPAMVPWGEISVLFLGGVPECLPCGFVRPAKQHKWKLCPRCGRPLTEWKTSAASLELVLAALEHGIETHMGRVNGGDRAIQAAAMGCTTGDGTYLAFGPDTNLPKLREWLGRMRNSQDQGLLFGGDAA